MNFFLLLLKDQSNTISYVAKIEACRKNQHLSILATISFSEMHNL